MREICEIVALRDVGGEPTDTVIGTFVLEGGKLSFTGGPDTAKRLMGVPAVVTGKDGLEDVEAKDQPALWFRELPKTFHGTYLHARIVT